MYAELTSFILKRTTAKSRDLTSAFRGDKQSNLFVKSVIENRTNGKISRKVNCDHAQHYFNQPR